MEPQSTTSLCCSTSKRRRFQVPITKYFSSGNTESPSNGSSHFNYAAPTHSPAPVLPHKVQSSLLTVGMRVRKSVPEGYKTTATKSAFHISHTGSSSTISPTRTMSTSYAELAPFCGVLKTGNLAVQTFPEHPSDTHQIIHHNHALDEEWNQCALPSSSQKSTDSSTIGSTIPPATLNTNKRRLEPDCADSDSEGDDDEYSNNFPRGFHQMWKSKIPVVSTPANSPSRPILLPRLAHKVGRYQNHQQQQQPQPHKARHCGQENNDPGVVSVAQAVDFEEASFLRRKEEVDDEIVGVEVEMGGV
ncbi:ribonucleotide reductase inhibitor domain-containing protein [Histoplasma capsulatum]|uniref:Ribonucleotide reductase inhibitor domain-containing protein n=2 Tax=Histoplasma TaxID=5036 RepID=A0A8A1ML22_AJECA|nr:ribonucleotide reductase inhibitor domain-containing protein [Histoplasma capsulatum]